MALLPTLVEHAAPFAAVFALASLGEMIVERTGRVNLGLEGLLYLAYGVAGYVSPTTGSLAAALAAAALAAALVQLLFYILVERLGVDQSVAGLSIVFLGIGLGDAIGVQAEGAVGPSLGGAAAVAAEVLAVAAVPLILYIVMYRSWIGYVLRSAGENEEAARFHGVPVGLVRLAALLAEAVLVAAAALLLLSLYGGVWRPGYALGFGWLSLGLVILGYWHPFGVAAASFLLSLLYAARPLLPSYGLPTQLVNALPYLAVIAALAAASVVYRRLGIRPPALVWRE